MQKAIEKKVLCKFGKRWIYINYSLFDQKIKTLSINPMKLSFFEIYPNGQRKKHIQTAKLADRVYARGIVGYVQSISWNFIIIIFFWTHGTNYEEQMFLFQILISFVIMKKKTKVSKTENFLLNKERDTYENIGVVNFLVVYLGVSRICVILNYLSLLLPHIKEKKGFPGNKQK